MERQHCEKRGERLVVTFTLRGFLLPTWTEGQGCEKGRESLVEVTCTLIGFLFPTCTEGQGERRQELREGLRGWWW